MGIEADNILWNKQEANVGGLMVSENGPNFSIAGAPTFPAGKFNNGLLVDVNTKTVKLTNTPAQFDFAQGIIDVWIMLTVAVVNGRSAGGSKPRLFTWWKDANEYFQVTFHNTLGLIWNLYDGISNKAWNNQDAGLDITANTLAHMIFVWNRLGIGATANTRRMYLNGVMVGSDNAAFVDTDMTTADLYMNALYNGSVIVNEPVLTDNIKWNPIATEANITETIANMNNEGWPAAAGGVRLIDGGLLKSNMLGGNVLIH